MIALIGCGYWGIKILRTLKQHISVVCEQGLPAVELIRQEFPHVKTVSEFSDVLADTGITSVMIALPAELHYKFAREALLAGKHVFVEKPLSINLDEITDLIRISREQDKLLTVGHLLHYHPHLTQIARMVRDGKIGRVTRIEAKRQSLGIFRKYDNVLWTVGIHDLSYILGLLGDDKVVDDSVQIQGQNLTGHSNLDLADVKFSTSSGIQVSLYCNWISPVKQQTLAIYGENGVIFADDVAKDFFYMDFKGDKTSIEPGDQYLPLAIECHHFLDCVRDRRQSLTSAERVLPVYQFLDGLERRWQRQCDDKPRYSCHQSAFIDEGVEVGDGSKLWHNCHLSRGSQIGQDCSLGQNSYLGDNVKLGDRCRLQNNANVYSGTVAGDDVFFGPNAIITNDKRPRIRYPCGGNYVTTTIESEVSIGAGAIIIAGVTLGRGCMIGAGSVVTRDVPPYTLVVGNPARVVGKIDERGERTSP